MQGAPNGYRGAMTTTPGSTPDPDPIGKASEADVAEQQQSVDGEGSPVGESLTDREAAESDAIDQGAPTGAEDDDGYPHAGEADVDRLG